MKHFIIGLGAALSCALPAHSATLVAYDVAVNGASIEASEFARGVDANDLSRRSGLLETGGGAFRSKGWTKTSDDDEVSDADKARSDQSSITWGFTSITAFDLTSLDIRYDGSNKGPKSITIDLVVNGGATVYDFYTDLSVDTAGETHLGIDLSAFDNVTSIDFILSGWGATKDKGTFEIENIDGGPGIRVSGEVAEVVDVAVVPVPAGLPLLLTGLGLFAVARRRK